MKILKAILVLSSLFAVSALFAQEPAASVRRVLEKFDPSRGFTVDFVIDGGMKGSLTVKGDRYRITGDEAVIFGDKSVKYTYIPANNEVMIDATGSEAAYSSPADLFRYSASADYTDAGTETVDGLLCRAVEVSGTEIVLYISADRLVAVRVKEGGRYHTVKPSVPRYGGLPEVVFREADYPGVEVIDFR